MKPRAFGSMLWLFTNIFQAFHDPKVRGFSLFTVSLIGIATVFYMVVEDWRLIDAAYFSVVTIATVGYGDFSPQTDLGKIFTIFYILTGISLFVAAGSALAENLLRRARLNQPDDIP